MRPIKSNPFGDNLPTPVNSVGNLSDIIGDIYCLKVNSIYSLHLFNWMF